MKGILGRKAGMSSVFTSQGKNIPVTVIEVQPNVVTAIMSKDKDGYKALQLSAFDRRNKTSTKALVGHMKKANTSAKYFVKEIRGMEGFSLGDKIQADIFKAGELVDVSGTSKGKGFQGNIKRHNQSIGPKSHGGGGGSQPVRQTGSLGDLVSNRVFKGMTMPGHMGSVKRTVQNLEVISVDKDKNIILVKGSIPGPNKSFVVVTEAVKGLPAREASQLVDVNEAKVKNELLEAAKKAGADVNTDMSIEEMKEAVRAAEAAKAAEDAAKAKEAEAAKADEAAKKIEDAAEKAHEEADKAKAAGNEEAAKELAEKAKALDSQAEKAEEKAKEVKEEAKEAEVAAEAKADAAASLQVEEEKAEEAPAEAEVKDEKKEEAK